MRRSSALSSATPGRSAGEGLPYPPARPGGGCGRLLLRERRSAFEQAQQRLRFARRGAGVAGDLRAHDGAVDDEQRQPGRFPGAGIGRIGHQGADVVAQGLLVLLNQTQHLAGIAGGFGGGVDKGATPKAGLFEPFPKGQRHDRQSRPGPLPPQRIHPMREPVHPELVPPAQKRQHQVLLRGKVAVKGHLGDPRLGDDAVDAGRADPVFIKQPAGSGENSLAGRGGRIGS
jgi:hypothetical protein